jgi:hypothetical protein
MTSSAFQNKMTAIKVITHRINSIIVTVLELHHQSSLTSDPNYIECLRAVAANLKQEYHDLHTQCTIDYSQEIADKLFIDLDGFNFDIQN